MTDETSEQRMARLRAESAMSPEREKELADLFAASAAAALARRGPLRDGDISRTKWAEPNHFRVVRPAPDSEPAPDREPPSKQDGDEPSDSRRGNDP